MPHAAQWTASHNKLYACYGSPKCKAVPVYSTLLTDTTLHKNILILNRTEVQI